MPCAGALECGGQIWNHGRVGLRRRKGELKIIGRRVPNRAWAPILVFDFNQVKTLHAAPDAPTAPNVRDEARRAMNVRHGTESPSRPRLQHAYSPLSPQSFLTVPSAKRALPVL